MLIVLKRMNKICLNQKHVKIKFDRRFQKLPLKHQSQQKSSAFFICLSFYMTGNSVDQIKLLMQSYRGRIFLHLYIHCQYYYSQLFVADAISRRQFKMHFFSAFCHLKHIIINLVHVHYIILLCTSYLPSLPVLGTGE